MLKADFTIFFKTTYFLQNFMEWIPVDNETLMPFYMELGRKALSQDYHEVYT